MPSSLTSTDLFEIEEYSIHRPGSTEYREALANARKQLAETNCARLEGFVRPGIITQMQQEAVTLAPQATYTRKNLNPYLEESSESDARDHPRNRFSSRVHGMVRGDLFTEDSVIRAIFDNSDLCRFVADCLGKNRLYTYRDPYGCININVQPPGSEFAWHFDHNEFTVSLGLIQPNLGGYFEYAPNIRDDDNENYSDVQALLDGDQSRVQRLALRPGDLQLFRGSHTLHRVTAPRDGERLSLLLSYVSDPDHIATAEYARRLWGESHPLHHAAHEA